MLLQMKMSSEMHQEIDCLDFRAFLNEIKKILKLPTNTCLSNSDYSVILSLTNTFMKKQLYTRHTNVHVYLNINFYY